MSLHIGSRPIQYVFACILSNSNDSQRKKTKIEKAKKLISKNTYSLPYK
jgi:hypothetical protein